MRKRFLEEHYRGIYSYMILSETLWKHLAEVDEECNEMMGRLVERMAKNESVTEQLKSDDQMCWIQKMNSIRSRAEEVMLQNCHVDYKYAEKHYAVDIVDCTVMPQCYAAIADIGNGAMNVMILNNGKASESKSQTVRLGMGECFKVIRDHILDRKTEELPAEIIENYLRYGDTKVGGNTSNLWKKP